ncbi:hypothetical protein G6F65_022270 [Rhizopus arrhizus]|nr:hypothetical protein G6F65_022270 [Rhizopus arrhizus]
MPPNVFEASTAPAPCPRRSGGTAMRNTAGNAAPSSSVGNSTTVLAATANRPLMPAISLSVQRRIDASARLWALISQRPSSAASTSATRPAPATRNPKTRQGSPSQRSQRAYSAAPTANPAR